MASKKAKLLHALHNEEVCDYLCPKTDYVDWVCITAFYSAIHYVDHKIFPFNDKDNDGNKYRIKCIDEYRNIYQSDMDKHRTREKLVGEKLSYAKPSFSFLRSLGHNSRYIDYTFKDPDKVIKSVKERLNEIKGLCTV